MTYKKMKWSPEIQAKLDALDFHFSPYGLKWSLGTAQEQEQKWMRDLARCSVMPWQLAGAIGCWLLTTKGGYINTALFWITLLVVRCYRIRRMLKKKENEKEGYCIARREIFRQISLGYTPAWEVYFGFADRSKYDNVPYDDELRKEKRAAFSDYEMLYQVGRTSGQGFDINLNKKLDIKALTAYYKRLGDKASEASDRKKEAQKVNDLKAWDEAWEELKKLGAERERITKGDVHEWET